jgi:hypothetical protein
MLGIFGCNHEEGKYCKVLRSPPSSDRPGGQSESLTLGEVAHERGDRSKVMMF